MTKIKSKKLILPLLGLALILSGCGQESNGGMPGFYKYLAIPGENIMNWLAKYVGGYGWAVIVLTIIVRLILMPVMIKQIKQTTVQQEKISLIRPQLKKLQEKQRNASSREEQATVSQDMMKLYQQNNISMTGGIGCLPILIQLPVFTALYATIRYSTELSHSVFMGIRLGESSLWLAILSFVAYLLQSFISLNGVSTEQKRQMRIMLLISPVVILFVTLNSPAGLGIYFFIGGLFACLQTFIINLYRPSIKRRVAEQAKQNKVTIDTNVNNDKEDTSNDNNSNGNDSNLDNKSSNDEQSTNKSEDIHTKNRKRNSGKQDRSK